MTSTEAEVRPTEALAVVEPTPLPVEALLQTAIQAGASVETLEKLLTLHERVKATQARDAYFEALSAFQAECPVIRKRKTATVETKTGGRYTYNYAPLEDIVKAVSPLLRQYGLSYRFDTRLEDNPPAQVVSCTVHHVQGHSESSEFKTPVDSGARMNDMQKVASAQTYAKRYAFCNALGILTGDDDDDGASGGSRSAATRPAQPTSSPSGERRETAAPRPVGKNLVPLKRTPRETDEGRQPDGRHGSEQGREQRTGVVTPAPAHAPTAPASLREDPLAATRQEMLERAVALEFAERQSNELEPLAEDVALIRGRKRCDQALRLIAENYGREVHTLATATKGDLEALNRIIERQFSKVSVKVEATT